MISKRPAAEESKIWARSKSIWEHCSHDVSENSPASSLTQTLLECGPKIEAKYGEQIRSNLLGMVGKKMPPRFLRIFNFKRAWSRFIYHSRKEQNNLGIL
ncbi:hypothetical protein Tsubulata_006054, partial [Turnera subulata]